jgi:hypothetical protein
MSESPNSLLFKMFSPYNDIYFLLSWKIADACSIKELILTV